MSEQEQIESFKETRMIVGGVEYWWKKKGFQGISRFGLYFDNKLIGSYSHLNNTATVLAKVCEGKMNYSEPRQIDVPNHENLTTRLLTLGGLIIELFNKATNET